MRGKCVIAIKITVDSARCDGFGNCVMAATDIFELGDDGRVRLKVQAVGADRLDALRRAVYDCPVNANVFTEVADP